MPTTARKRQSKKLRRPARFTVRRKRMCRASHCDLAAALPFAGTLPLSSVVAVLATVNPVAAAAQAILKTAKGKKVGKPKGLPGGAGGVAKAFDSIKHPHGEHGRFIETPDAPKPEPKPKAKQAQKKAVAGEHQFPASLEDVSFVKHLGGSTGAKLVRAKNGEQYVMKSGANSKHIQEEHTADQLYRHFGVNVPEGKLYQHNGQTVKMSRYVEGRHLKDLEGAERGNAVHELRKHYAVDALLGNHDVVGLDQDNIIVDKHGKVWRVDNGGSLHHRAMGELKDDKDFDAHPHALFSMSERGSSKQAFGGMSYEEKLASMGHVVKHMTPKRLQAMKAIAGPELHEKLVARAANMADLHKHSHVFMRDGWTGDYTGLVMQHRLGIRAAGIEEKLPTELLPRNNGSCQLYDQHGRAFGYVREQLPKDMDAYLKKHGSSNGPIESWIEEHGCESVSDAPLAAKLAIASFVKPHDLDAYAYGRIVGTKVTRKAKEAMIRANDSPLRWDAAESHHAIAANHAATYALLQKADMNRNDRKAGLVSLLRTENEDRLRDQGITNFSSGTDFVLPHRMPYDCYSHLQTVNVTGKLPTTVNVPHSRVLFTYAQSHHLSPDESEFLARTDNLPATIQLKGFKWPDTKHSTVRPALELNAGFHAFTQSLQQKHEAQLHKSIITEIDEGKHSGPYIDAAKAWVTASKQDPNVDYYAGAKKGAEYLQLHLKNPSPSAHDIAQIQLPGSSAAISPGPKKNGVAPTGLTAKVKGIIGKAKQEASGLKKPPHYAAPGTIKSGSGQFGDTKALAKYLKEKHGNLTDEENVIDALSGAKSAAARKAVYYAKKAMAIPKSSMSYTLAHGKAMGAAKAHFNSAKLQLPPKASQGGKHDIQSAKDYLSGLGLKNQANQLLTAITKHSPSDKHEPLHPLLREAEAHIGDYYNSQPSQAEKHIALAQQKFADYMNAHPEKFPSKPAFTPVKMQSTKPKSMKSKEA